MPLRFTTARLLHARCNAHSACVRRARGPCTFVCGRCPARCPPHRSFSTAPHADANGARVVLGLGSNMGDRRLHLQRALLLLAALPSTRLTGTSFLYESSPVSVRDQPPFLNAAANLLTRLSPHELLTRVKAIEASEGRDLLGAPRHGPRPLDVDVLLYGDERVQSEQLTIPHATMHERLFVLEPLSDVLRPEEPLAALDGATVSGLRAALLQRRPPASNDFVHRVLPLGPSMHRHSERTLLMGVLNVTPDSFSDGGVHSQSLSSAVERALRMADAGADVIDVGGESTRPGAAPVSGAEERRRVLPVLTALRAARPQLALSVDTRNSNTAEAAVDAGAVLINDVSGGLHDPRMLDTAARLGVTYVCSHIRGDPQSMVGLAQYSGDVVAEVRSELSRRVDAALSAGVARWSLLLDPGLGFAKNAQHNVCTAAQSSARIDGDEGMRPLLTCHLRCACAASVVLSSRCCALCPASVLRRPTPCSWAPRGRDSSAMYCAVRGSRQRSAVSAAHLTPPSIAHRRFPARSPLCIRPPLYTDPRGRSWTPSLSAAPPPPVGLADRVQGSVACAVAAVAGGATMVRVHDVGETVAAVRVADAIHRGWPR